MKTVFFNDGGYIKKEATGAGVYQFILKKGQNKKVLYIGESYSMLSRCAQHIYELEKDTSYFGLTEHWNDESLELVVDIYESVNVEGLSNSKRDILLREKELKVIEKEKPLAQNETSDILRKQRAKYVKKYLDSI